MKKIILFILLASVNISFSQWSQHLNGVSIWSLAKDRSFTNLYAGSLGSTSAIYRSTDHGYNWQILTSGNGQTIFSIDVDSVGNIFAANFGAGMLISTNNGLNFITQPVSTFGGQNVQAVKCGKNRNVYAGTNGGGIYRSTNYGQTWSFAGLTSTQVITIAVDEYDHSIVYAGTTSTSSGPNGFYRSTDFGATFSSNLNSGINIYGILQVNPLTLITVSTSTGGPIHKSTDGGLNWSILTSGYVARGITSSSIQSNYAIFISGNGGVFYSLTGGSSFINSGLTYSATPVLGASGKVYAGLSGSSNGGVWIFTETPMSVNPENKIPMSFSLSQNYPNPFNPSTKIRFAIPYASSVAQTFLSVYNILGREVVALVNQQLSPGTYEVDFDASNCPSGLYFYKLTSGDFTETKKMLLIK